MEFCSHAPSRIRGVVAEIERHALGPRACERKIEGHAIDQLIPAGRTDASSRVEVIAIVKADAELD